METNQNSEELHVLDIHRCMVNLSAFLSVYLSIDVKEIFIFLNQRECKLKRGIGMVSN